MPLTTQGSGLSMIEKGLLIYDAYGVVSKTE